MNPDTLFYLEMRLVLFDLAAIAAWVIFDKIPVKEIVLLSTSLLILCGSLRPDTYNSDTYNYASYATLLSVEKGLDIYTITKLEPFHILLLDIARDFYLWLIFEGLIALIFLIIAYVKIKRPEPFLITCGFFATLFTSSMRFAIALLVLAVLLSWKKNRSAIYLAIMSVIGGCVHAVMLAAGPLSSRFKWIPLALPGAILILVVLDSELRNRIAIDLADVKSIGLKSFATFICINAYCSYKSAEYKSERAAWDFFGYSSIFLVTALYFPGINRIIIIGAMIVSMELDRHRESLRRDIYIDRAAILLIFSMITIPYIVITPNLYKYNMW